MARTSDHEEGGGLCNSDKPPSIILKMVRLIRGSVRAILKVACCIGGGIVASQMAADSAI
jgi:hypothetical protein